MLLRFDSHYRIESRFLIVFIEEISFNFDIYTKLILHLALLSWRGLKLLGKWPISLAHMFVSDI